MPNQLPSSEAKPPVQVYETKRRFAERALPDAPTIGILALSAIADDPRVRRQGDAFARAGWQVIGVGLPGARSGGTEWPIWTRDDPPPGFATLAPTGTETKWQALEGYIKRRLRSALRAVHLGPLVRKL